MLAHELRNPLAPIRTGLELLKMVKHEPETIEEIRGTMERQTNQLVTLVDDLLDVSRITRGKLELRKCRVLLADVIQSAVEASRSLIDDGGHNLDVSLPEQSIRLEVDPNRLAQVFSNLLNNAAKYTPDGGQIWLKAERQGSEVVVSVADNGVGISESDLGRIFEIFAQCDQPLEKAHTGLGIGLTLVKSLVEMHGGSIEVRSHGPGRGSEFIVRLPNITDAPGQQARPTASLEQAMPKSHPRILVVDDNQAAASMLSRLFATFGHEVRTAADGQEAIDIAADFRPDLVLMDLGMPRVDGYEAARRMRDHDWGQQMTLVALSGWGQGEDKRKTHEAGFDEHLVKPPDLADLRRILAGIEPKHVTGEAARQVHE
jgi:CheY-like chemotaxis protein/two-component sensor histidine kinase